MTPHKGKPRRVRVVPVERPGEKPKERPEAPAKKPERERVPA